MLEQRRNVCGEKHLADDVASSRNTTESTFTKSNDDEGELECC